MWTDETLNHRDTRDFPCDWLKATSLSCYINLSSDNPPVFNLLKYNLPDVYTNSDKIDSTTNQCHKIYEELLKALLTFRFSCFSPWLSWSDIEWRFVVEFWKRASERWVQQNFYCRSMANLTFLLSIQELRHHRVQRNLAKVCCSACKVWPGQLVIKVLIWLDRRSREFKHSIKTDALRCSLLMTRTPTGRNIFVESACTVRNEVKYWVTQLLMKCFPFRWLWHPSRTGGVQWNFCRCQWWRWCDSFHCELSNWIEGNEIDNYLPKLSDSLCI